MAKKTSKVCDSCILKEVFRRLSFRLDYEHGSELKTAIIYFFSVFVFLRLLAVGLRHTQFFSLVLTIGALVYLIATLYFVHKLFQPRFKKHLDIYHFGWALVYSVIFIWMVYLMFAPITIGAENTVISLIVSLLLVILPASFSDEIIGGLKEKLYPFMFFIPAMPNLTDINMSDVSNLVSGKLPDLTSPFPNFDIINTLVSKYGLELLIAVIIIALLSLRVIRTILQLLLVLIIIWAISKFFGFF